MKMSERTKKYFWGRFLIVLDWIFCFGTALMFILIAASGVTPDPNGVTMKEKLGTILWGLGASIVPMIVLAIIVKDKIKPTVWMVDIVLANYLYGDLGMYIVLGIWLVSEYIIVPLSRRFATKYLINKELDIRSQNG